MASASGGRENRRKESAGDAGNRERARILRDGEDSGSERDRDEQHERELGGKQFPDLESTEHDEIQHSDAAALQDEAVAAGALAQPPAENQHDDRTDRDARESHLDRHVDVLAGVANQK